jgi:phosphonate transport system substrate-binding protein
MGRFFISTFFALTMVLSTGCMGMSTNTPASYVAPIQLSKLQPLPTRVDQSVVPLRVAVAAVISPQGTLQGYQSLLDYLSARLHRPIQLVQRRTYAEVNALIEDGTVDLAFVCTSAYIDGHRRFDMDLLVAPRIKGETVYYSVLVVPTESKANNIADMRGKVFAFTDPMSMTGRMYPVWLLREMGYEPENFFWRTTFTYGHDDAIRAVAARVVDGAMVDSLVYDYALSRDPFISQNTRVIYKSQPFGIPPVVTGPHIRPRLRMELQQMLLNMAEDPDPLARKALFDIGVERFVMIEDSAYQSARTLITSLRETTSAISP